MAEEEASLPSKPKANPKASGKKKAESKPAGPGAIAAGGGIASPSVSKASSVKEKEKEERPEEPESFSATGIDAALELMEVTIRTRYCERDSREAQMTAVQGEMKGRRRVVLLSYEAYLMSVVGWAC